jgi:hypothetical protein
MTMASPAGVITGEATMRLSIGQDERNCELEGWPSMSMVRGGEAFLLFNRVMTASLREG